MAAHLVHRLIQKWKYHTGNAFQKKVAEINRNEPLVFLNAITFKVRGCDLSFSKKDHSFILDRYHQFEELLKGRGQFRIEGAHLLYTIDSVTLKVTTAEEIFIIHEIFFERCYLVVAPWNYSVIDIGMNVGFASLFFANNDRVSRVYGFEPFKPTFSDAKANFELNPRLRAKIIPNNVGLSSKNESRKLAYSIDLKGKNSIHDTRLPNEDIELKEAKEIIDTIVQANPQEHFFVKMDCEGAEFEIFDSLQKQRIPDQIFGFIIEWHFKNPQPIIDVLISNGYKVQLRGGTEIGLITAFR